MTSLILDPFKTPILLWRHRSIANAFVLKTPNQKQLIGFARIDKGGEVYWKFQDWSKYKELEIEPNY